MIRVGEPVKRYVLTHTRLRVLVLSHVSVHPVKYHLGFLKVAENDFRFEALHRSDFVVKLVSNLVVAQRHVWGTVLYINW